VTDFEQLGRESDPYPIYHMMRGWGRVLWLDQVGRWMITGHREALSVLRDSKFSSDRSLSDDYELPPGAERPPGGMFVMDPPDHTRLRTLVQKAFTARVIERMRARVDVVVSRLLDACDGQAEVDLMAAFACPLPAIVLAELLGIPQEQHQAFQRWTTTVIETIDPVSHQLVSQDGVQAREEMERCLSDIIDERRRHPQPDLISGLVQAEESGDRLTSDELLEMCLLLIVAGFETTANLIGNGVHALLEHPDQLARLRGDPELIGTAVEELLRYDSPIQVSGRIPREDVELDGHLLRKGQTVGILVGAANRDPEAFAEPDRLDLGRTPNNHIALGRGIHFCLGAPLARLEGATALTALVDRFPKLQSASPPTRRNNLHVRGFMSLPVALT
jgi:pimeloyl-[acyl-carrier protein] synthase